MKTQDNKKQGRNIRPCCLWSIKTDTLLKPAFMLALILSLTLPANRLQAQNENLFRYVDRNTMELTDQQAKILDYVDSQPFTKEVKFVYPQFLQTLEQRNTLQLNFSEDRSIEVQRKDIHRNQGTSFTWSGKINESYANILFTVNNGNITGQFQTLDFQYIITPLGRGLHALYEIDHTKSPPDHPEVDTSKKLKTSAEFNKANLVENDVDKMIKPKSQIKAPQTVYSTSNSIDLLVLYTTQVKNSSINILDEIDQAYNKLDESLSNSNISATVNLVHTYEVSYVDSGYMQKALGRLQNPDDGYMDEIHNIREAYGANIVSLIVASGEGCGFAGEQKADYSTGFTVVRKSCIEPFLTFAHEIGHLVGADHSRTCDYDPNSGPTYNTDYQYGHGYNVPEIQSGTIMACVQPRINHWSNPYVYWGNPIQQKLTSSKYSSIQSVIPLGTTDHENNAKVWNERWQEVAAFEPEGMEVFSVQLMGPSQVEENNNGMWFASASGGEAPYSYLWERSYNSSNGPWTQVGSGGGHSQIVTHDMWLRVTANDSSSPFSLNAQSNVLPV